MSDNSKTKYAETHLGTFGGLLPLITMVVVILGMSILGYRGTLSIWAAAFLAVIVGLFTFKDKSEYQHAILDTFKSPTVSVLTMILIVASVFAKVLVQGGLADAMFAVLTRLNTPAGAMPLVAFAISAFISIGTGSASASLMTLLPVLLPVSVAMGQSAGLMVGAIVSGGMFGDNLAPISDSAITSVMAVGADMRKAVRSRIKYAVVALIPTTILFGVLGFKMAVPQEGAALDASGSLFGLIFMILPVILLVMIIKKIDFLVALISVTAVGIMMLLVTGKLTLDILLGSNGIIASGIAGCVNTIILILLVFVVITLTERSGSMAKLVSGIEVVAKSTAIAEIVCGLVVSIFISLTGTSLSGMGICGPVVVKVMDPFRVTRERTANWLCGLSMGIANVIPWAGSTAAVVGMVMATGVVGADFTGMDYIKFNIYALVTIVVYWGAILTGFGRDYENADVNEKAE